VYGMIFMASVDKACHYGNVDSFFNHLFDSTISY